jgi:hypothetical protein
MLISITTSQLYLIPEITPLLPGFPIAKWTWFLAILFKPEPMINGRGSK